MEFIPSSLHKPALIKETVRKLKRFWEFTGIPDKIFISIGNISHQTSTKCSLVSDIARTFDVLGWGITNNTTHEDTVPAFLLDWDQEVPPELQEQHQLWKEQLNLFKTFPFLDAIIDPMTLSQARNCTDSPTCPSKLCSCNLCSLNVLIWTANNHSGCSQDQGGTPEKAVYPSFGAKRSPTPCSTHHFSQEHPRHNTYARCNSTIVLHWQDGNPRRFKTFVGNGISSILDLLLTRTWRHVPTEDNPAECASRGLLPKDLLAHTLWMWGPPWLHKFPV